MWVTGPAGRRVELSHESGSPVARGVIDDFGTRLADLGADLSLRGLGGLVLRDIAPGEHVLRVGRRRSRLRVPAEDELPDDYDDRVLGQSLGPGWGHVTTRDGTTLSAMVAFPDRDRWGPPPYPTVIEYSPYRPSHPATLTGRPEDDIGVNTEVNVARHLGYAVVGLNLRGSGGSGGSLRQWDRVHALDGHDAVEAIARQPWCRAVGMIGRSAPGFTQLLVASTRPPSLAAITPAAVLGRTYGTGATPGGIPNTWVAVRLSGWSADDRPGLPEHAHPPRYEPGGWDDWVLEHLTSIGDHQGLRNQLLRGQGVSPLENIREFIDEVGGPARDPCRWAASIACPTLVIGSWQDQESGPGWADLLAAFPPSTDARLLGSNGTHEETRFPELVGHWAAFLAEHLRGGPQPEAPDAERYLREALAPLLGPAPLTLVPRPTTAAATLRLDNGNGPAGPGQPTAARVVELDAWPPPDLVELRLDLDADGALVQEGPTEAAALRFRYDPSSRAPTSAPPEGFDVNAPDPPYDWREPPDGHGLWAVSEPFDRDVLLVGESAVDLALRCTAPDVDLEVTLTEVRPDGWETYLQAGWLRASRRHLDPEASTVRRPVPTYRRDDAAVLPVGAWSRTVVPVPAVAHLLRTGSRLGLRIEAPGGTQPSWTFGALWPDGEHDGVPVEVEVGVGPGRASSLVVGLIDASEVPPAPPPGALRRQPSRVVAAGRPPPRSR